MTAVAICSGVAATTRPASASFDPHDWQKVRSGGLAIPQFGQRMRAPDGAGPGSGPVGAGKLAVREQELERRGAKLTAAERELEERAAAPPRLSQNRSRSQTRSRT